ncbi:hypothetical protein PRIPAC_91449 [Pristionchus pacificus]|uniref:Uncharacterized protein n=1 Tax=Pristionchus pacificus TaxID=54126 RepID=A0A2A6BYX0_PRIPA|nr:hypothetical protein PRIPAC_91449 [Pristionchus pacificus]|eukprot:PDM71090.1 hypothetical protein PRIPAC_44488 [Pristionchus pacificus]
MKKCFNEVNRFEELTTKNDDEKEMHGEKKEGRVPIRPTIGYRTPRVHHDVVPGRELAVTPKVRAKTMRRAGDVNERARWVVALLSYPSLKLEAGLATQTAAQQTSCDFSNNLMDSRDAALRQLGQVLSAANNYVRSLPPTPNTTITLTRIVQIAQYARANRASISLADINRLMVTVDIMVNRHRYRDGRAPAGRDPT